MSCSCGAGSNGDAGANACVPTVETPVDLWATTSDYESGEVASLATSARCARRAAASATGDSLVARHGTRVVVMDYTTTVDQIAVYSPRPNGALVLDGAASARDGDRSANVRGYLAIDERFALFSRNNQSSLGVFDTATFSVSANIALDAFAQDAPRAAPSTIVRVGERAFVTIQRWDAMRLSSPRRGAIAVVDLATRTLVDADTSTPALDAIELPFANPFGQMALRGGDLFVPCAGALRTIGDGAIVRVDTARMRVAETLGDERAFGGNPLHVLALDDDRLLIVAMTEPGADDRMTVGSTRLVEWSVAARAVVRTWIEVPEYALTAPVLGSDGRVYIGDRGSVTPGLERRSGIVAFDAQSGARAWAEPLSLGLPPYSLVAR